MSLIVNGGSGANYDPIPQGTYLAVCNLLVDLGVQYNETYKNNSRKVMIGWEIPDETIEREDGTHTRTINKKYTASLNESATLRQDLAAWRGRDFTPEELAAFDLHSIVGKSCMISVIHRDYNGRPYANVGSIMALPKGTKPGKLSEDVIVFDLDSASIEDVEKLPKWIADTIKKSSTYKEKTMTPPEVTELPEDDGDLPF